MEQQAHGTKQRNLPRTPPSQTSGKLMVRLDGACEQKCGVPNVTFVSPGSCHFGFDEKSVLPSPVERLCGLAEEILACARSGEVPGVEVWSTR